MFHRCLLVLALVAIGLPIAVADPAQAARLGGIHQSAARTKAVVHRGWPLRRPARAVVVRPARAVPRVKPAAYLAPVAFTGAAAGADRTSSHPNAFAWDDAERLIREEDWTEFTLRPGAPGKRMSLAVAGGTVQFDWAEVVFENGEARVVDFKSSTHGPGYHQPVDFRDGRKVDHVRVVARSRTYEAKIVLRAQS